MKKSYVFILILATVALVISACGKKEYKAEDVNEETDTCDVCNMAVPNNQHATQIILEDEKVLKFDDLGCLYAWKKDNKDAKIGAEFVRDFDSKEWIEVKDATFVYDKEFMTPMAYGIYSFTNKKDAEGLIDKEGKGEIMDAKALNDHHWERNKEMMKHGGHDDHDEHGEEDGNDHE